MLHKNKLSFFFLQLKILTPCSTVTAQQCAMVQVLNPHRNGTDFCAPGVSPAVIDAVGPLVERERFDLVLTHLAGFRLQPWGYVGLKRTILTLD